MSRYFFVLLFFHSCLKHLPVRHAGISLTKSAVIFMYRLQDGPYPGPKYRWIRRYKHQSGAYIGGYWRPPCGVGFSWVDGYWDAKGAWVFGNCNPAKLRKNYMWAPGYWDSSVWIKGYWRPRKKAGFAWAPGHYNNKGIWIKGHWRK